MGTLNSEPQRFYRPLTSTGRLTTTLELQATVMLDEDDKFPLLLCSKACLCNNKYRCWPISRSFKNALKQYALFQLKCRCFRLLLPQSKTLGHYILKYLTAYSIQFQLQVPFHLESCNAAICCLPVVLYLPRVVLGSEFHLPISSVYIAADGIAKQNDGLTLKAS